MELPHFHKNEQGFFVRCYHHSRTAIMSVGFWIGLTIGFPIEHFLWEKVEPFKTIAHWMGL